MELNASLILTLGIKFQLVYGTANICVYTSGHEEQSVITFIWQEIRFKTGIQEAQSKRGGGE